MNDGCSDQSAMTTVWLKNRFGQSKLNRMMPPRSKTQTSAMQSVLNPTMPLFSSDSLTKAEAISVTAEKIRGGHAVVLEPLAQSRCRSCRPR